MSWLSSCLITHPPSTLYDLVECYNSTLSQLINKHAPLKSKIIRTKPLNAWYTQALKIFKLAKHPTFHLERNCSRIYSSENLKSLRSATNHYHTATRKAERTYNSSIISISSSSLCDSYRRKSAYLLTRALCRVVQLFALNNVAMHVSCILSFCHYRPQD